MIISGKPCDICGNVGIAQAILTCSNCHKSREHIYCMRPNLSSVPESWCCERCQCHLHHHDNFHCESSVQCKQEVEDLYRRKTECTMGNESSKVPDATQMGDVRMHRGSFSSNILPTSTTSPGGDQVYKSTGRPEFLTLGRVGTCDQQKQNSELSQPLHGLESSLKYPGESLTSGTFGSLEVTASKVKLHISDEARLSPQSYNCASVYGLKEKSQIDKKLLGMSKQAGTEGSLLSKDCVNSKLSFKFGEEDLPNPPAVEALWKGSFAVLDFCDDLYDGVEAYPPRKLSHKAWSVLKGMPSVLQFKLKPRLHVWPKTFLMDSPSGFDIAFYFWADDLCRSRENYNHLMQWMVEKDLCMVSRLNGVELLIFTSRQLSVECQTLNKRFYLWGVFMALEGRHSYDSKGKRAATFPLPSCRVGEDFVNSNDCDDQVLDMKVDMVGVPPGFRKKYALEGKNSSVYLNGKHVCNAPVLCSKVHDDSEGARDNIDDQDMDMDADIVGGNNYKIPNICPGRKSLAECLNNLNKPSQEVPTRFILDQSTEENATAMLLHQTRTNQCNNDACRISRPVAINIAHKGPISTSLVTMSPVHCKEHLSLGIFESNKLDEENTSAKGFKSCQQEVLMQQAPIHKQMVVKENAMVQQQQESMYHRALLRFPQVEEISSENLPPSFDQPGLLPSSKVEPIPCRTPQKMDIVRNREFGSADICSRRNSKVSHWDNSDNPSLDAFTKVHSDRLRYLNQTKRNHHDLDVPPGFRRKIEPDKKNPFVALKEEKHVSDAPVFHSKIHGDLAGVTDEVDDHEVDMDIDMVGGKNVGKADICLGSNSMSECLDNLDTPHENAITRMHSDRSRYLHQTKREHFNDYDVPPGFQRRVAMEGKICSPDLKRSQHVTDASGLSSEIHEDSGLSSEIHEDSAGVADGINDHEVHMDVDMMRENNVGKVDICLDRNSVNECLDNSGISSQDIFARVNYDPSTVTASQLHQTRVEECDVDASRISRPVPSDAANNGPPIASLISVSSIQHIEDASSGISESTKQAEQDSPTKGFKPLQEEVLMQQALLQKQIVMIQKAPIQQQEQSMHQPALLPSPPVEAIASENLAAGFDQPSLLPSPKVGPIPNHDLQPGRLPSSMGESIPNGNVQPGFVQPGLLPSSEAEAVPNGNLCPGFVQPGLLPCSRVEPVPNENLWPGFVQPGLLPCSRVDLIPNGNPKPGFFQPGCLPCYMVEPIPNVNPSPHFYQTQLIQSGSVSPVFYQPSVFPSPHIEPSSGGNLYPSFDTSTRRSVYVSDIPLQVTKSLLREIFTLSGAVVNCWLTAKGEFSYGCVDYFDHQSAARAISTFNGRQLFGQPIKVCWANVCLPRDAFNIYVGNLCPQVTDEILFGFFSVLPSCLTARVVRDNTHGWSKGYGFVSFRDQQDAQNAIHPFTGMQLGSRQIQCNWAVKGAGSNNIVQHHSDAIQVMELTSGSSVH